MHVYPLYTHLPPPVFMCIRRIHMYTHRYACVYAVYACTLIGMHVYTPVYACILTGMHVYTPYTHVHSPVCMCIPPYTHVHSPVCMCIHRIRMYTHQYSCVYALYSCTLIGIHVYTPYMHVHSPVCTCICLILMYTHRYSCVYP